jgi:hypothetical protein
MSLPNHHLLSIFRRSKQPENQGCHGILLIVSGVTNLGNLSSFVLGVKAKRWLDILMFLVLGENVMIPITINSCDCSYWAIMIVVSVEIVKNVRIFILVFQR